MHKNNLKEEIIRISGASPNKCMKCGKCSATCPSFNEMEIAPHMFVDMVIKGRVEQLVMSDATNHCLSCFACVERCPRGVEPAHIIEAIRVIKLRQSGAPQITPAQIASVIDTEIPQQALVSAFRKFRK